MSQIWWGWGGHAIIEGHLMELFLLLFRLKYIASTHPFGFRRTCIAAIHYNQYYNLLLEIEIAFFRRGYNTLHSQKVAHRYIYVLKDIQVQIPQVHSYRQQRYVLYSVKSIGHVGLSRFDLTRQESDGYFNSQSVL